MNSKLREGMTVLSEEGLTDFIREVIAYLYEVIYWTFHDKYKLSIYSTSVTFSAPNRTVVQRNKRRFNSEKPEIFDLLEEIEPDDVFFDVGANTGLYTLFAAKKCPKGEVVAFEPYPPNSRLLQQDTKRNDLKNVDIRNVALSGSEGTVKFDQPSKDDIGYGSGSIDTKSQDSFSKVEVTTITGDKLILDDAVKTPNVVKIDVEGAEPLVVDGLEKGLSSPECRLVYCEVHQTDVEYRPNIRDFGMSLEEMKTRFNRLGFEVEELETHGSEVTLKCKK